MSKRPTIHDVAERAGVSKSLVALVFKSAEGVGSARRERVLQAAAELGYTPNAWARSLRTLLDTFRRELATEIPTAITQPE